MSDLTAQRCEPCEGGVAPLTRDEAQALMDQLHEDWSLTEDATEIRRDYQFKGFNKTMGFVNAVAWIANGENHHPDLEVGWGHCLVRYTTHAIGGLSQNDFICAAKIDALLP
jgi:4a-hydroxytetrahydrobiopterin dehydratase